MDDSNLLPIWSALADAKRRQILDLLKESPRTTSELCQHFDVSRFAVMKHLNVLEQANLIVVRREGRKRWNILNDQSIDRLKVKQADENGSPEEPSGIFDFPPVAAQTTWGLEPIGVTIIDQETRLKAPSAVVFRALTEQIDHWWCWRSPDVRSVCLEPIVGGRFYHSFQSSQVEQAGGNGSDGELWARVTYIKRDEEIRLDGPMGLADGEAVSSVRLRLEPRAEGTRLRLRHRLMGQVDEPMVERFKSHWRALIDNDLKAFVEKAFPNNGKLAP